MVAETRVRDIDGRLRDIEDRRGLMIASVTGTVVQHAGTGVRRQDRPKTVASIRRIAVPELAAEVLRRRLVGPGPEDRARSPILE